tara:strand:- start:915 stop:1082 length:168 start_codon:yes stop_codon:yes gene_type:complete
MSSSDRVIVIVVAIIMFGIVAIVGIYHNTTQAAFKNGYEEATVVGSNMSFWKKAN